jgi:LuxR family maltose regulon positive regulatory protein
VFLISLPDYLPLIYLGVIRRNRIDVLPLPHDAEGGEPSALEKPAESLGLAEPGGLIRNFLDLGAPMADLLNRLLKQNVAVEYTKKPPAAFGDDEQVPAPELIDLSAEPVPAAITRPLVEPLTNLELDILGLLEQRFQNKEIAEKLFISIETVNTHLNNNRKLNVKPPTAGYPSDGCRYTHP